MKSAGLTDAFLCRSCSLPLPIASFRVLRTEPTVRFYDFCRACEKQHGVVALYTKLAGAADEAVLDHVLKSGNSDPVAAAIENNHQLAGELEKQEMAKRALAKRRLVYFIKRFFPKYTPGWVHHDICRRLEKFVEDVEAGLQPRLILTVPPRHGKSTIVSDNFVSWVLGKHPEWEVISTSYAVSLPIGFSRKIRDRIKSPLFKALFPEAGMRADSQNVEAWTLEGGGGYVAAGVGGSITGKGANILVIDDPFKDQEEASSENIREKVWDWFNTTAMSRLAPEAGVLIIQTRWHDADLAGRCITTMKEQLEAGADPDEIDQWEVVSYPAIAEEDEYLFPDGAIELSPDDPPEGARLLRVKGEALHPARYPLKILMRIKNRMPPSQWNALYQQNPVPDDGDFFSRDQFRYVASLPGHRDEYVFFCAWDTAIESKKRNDWTVGVVGAMNDRNELYVIDMIRGRMGSPQIIDSICSFMGRYPLFKAGVEKGQIYSTLKPMLEDRMRRDKHFITLDDTLQPVTDKQVRAGPLQSMFQLGQVYFVKQPWTERAEGELLRFPNGTHDDIVDALAWLARMARTMPKPKTQRTRIKPKTSWKKRLKTTKAPTSFMTA